MVIVSRSLFVQQRARRVVRSFGVEDPMLDAAEAANPGLEWQRVVNALDRVFLSHGGAMGQVSFLHSPSSILNGRTPLEAIAEPDGPSKICDAARAFSARSQTPVEANISPLGFSTPAQPLGSADAR